MTKFVGNAPRTAAGGIARLMSGFGPQIMLEPETGAGADSAEAEANAAAAAEAAEREAAEKAAAEKEAADKAAKEKADKEAAEKAALEEAEKNMTEAEKEKSKLLREVMEKKNRIKESEAEKERLESELKKYEGLDLEKVRKLLEAEKTREQEELEKKGEFDRLKKMIAEEREAERKAFQEQIEALKAQNGELVGTVDKLTLGQQFNSSTFISDELVLTATKARALYGSHFEMQDGKIVAYDKPSGTSGRTMYVDAAGEPLAFDAAMKKIIDADPEKDTLLKVKQKPGANSRSTVETSQQKLEKANAGEPTGRARIALGLKDL